MQQFILQVLSKSRIKCTKKHTKTLPKSTTSVQKCRKKPSQDAGKVYKKAYQESTKGIPKSTKKSTQCLGKVHKKVY